MCVNWLYTPGGKPRPCHVCWQCKRDRTNDWVGRCIAENKVSAQSVMATLTYGSDGKIDSVADHSHAHALFYSDVQLYLKRLRKQMGGGVRYVVAGEYGSKKGRAHWHLLLFFREQLPPDIRFGERYIHAVWPHGWSWFEVVTPMSVRYVLKYMRKLPDADQKNLFRFSTCPGIGWRYFARLAAQYVEQRLPPRLDYRFPGDSRRDGTLREYRLSRAAAYGFLSEYDRVWQLRYGNEDWPQSELMDEYVDVRNRMLRRKAGEEDMPLSFFVRKFGLQRLEWGFEWPEKTASDGIGARFYPRAGPYHRASRGE